MHPIVKSFFHAATSTFTHLIIDPNSRHAAVVDPVLDYALHSGHTGTAAAEEVARYIIDEDLRLEWVLETHAHADHLSAAPYFKRNFNAKVAIGAGICNVQQTFKEIFNLEETFRVDGSQFDRLFAEGETFSIGHLHVSVMNTPGHTNDSVTYIVGNAAFIGDTLFMPDYGTARCDFPGGDACQFYHSIQRLFCLPGDTRVYLCHDYIPEGVKREHRAWTTIEAQKAHNAHVGAGITENEFVTMRRSRDRTLDLPMLIIPSIQINIRAGQMPMPEKNGQIYLKVPLNSFGK